MASACALAIFSGKILLYFVSQKRLRAFLRHFFIEGVVTGKRHLQRRFLRKRGAAGNEPSQALPRQLSRRESQAVKFITKVLGAMRKLPAVLLPLPLGEVDLRSKDGEGARRCPQC